MAVAGLVGFGLAANAVRRRSLERLVIGDQEKEIGVSTSVRGCSRPVQGVSACVAPDLVSVRALGRTVSDRFDREEDTRSPQISFPFGAAHYRDRK